MKKLIVVASFILIGSPAFAMQQPNQNPNLDEKAMAELSEEQKKAARTLLSQQFQNNIEDVVGELMQQIYGDNNENQSKNNNNPQKQ